MLNQFSKEKSWVARFFSSSYTDKWIKQRVGNADNSAPFSPRQGSQVSRHEFNCNSEQRAKLEIIDKRNVYSLLINECNQHINSTVVYTNIRKNGRHPQNQFIVQREVTEKICYLERWGTLRNPNPGCWGSRRVACSYPAWASMMLGQTWDKLMRKFQVRAKKQLTFSWMTCRFGIPVMQYLHKFGLILPSIQLVSQVRLRADGEGRCDCSGFMGKARVLGWE